MILSSIGFLVHYVATLLCFGEMWKMEELPRSGECRVHMLSYIIAYFRGMHSQSCILSVVQGYNFNKINAASIYSKVGHLYGDPVPLSQLKLMAMGMNKERVWYVLLLLLCLNPDFFPAEVTNPAPSIFGNLPFPPFRIKYCTCTLRPHPPIPMIYEQ